VARGDTAFPESLRQRNAGRRLEGRYIVYCSRDGSVVRVETVQSIAGADASVVAALKARHFPATRPVKFELPVSLEFEAEAPPPPPTPTATATVTTAPPPTAPPPPSGPPSKKYRAVPPAVLDSSAVDARLPDVKVPEGKGGIGAYMVYVEPDGSVSRVDVLQSLPAVDGAITGKLRAWRFKRQAQAVRSVVRLVVGPGGVEKQ
jgi:hypothetical protein